jgi:hypothetical protein
MAQFQLTPTYSASISQKFSSVEGSSVLEHFEGAASLKVSVRIKVSSSNKQPKANNPLACDAETVTHNNNSLLLLIVMN